MSDDADAEQAADGRRLATAPPPTATVPLKLLPDAMEAMVYVQARWPLIVDTTGQATRFLRYQPGNFLMAINQKDMEKENLRRCLLGCLAYGHDLTVDLGSSNLEIAQFFDPRHFPRALLDGDPCVVNTPEFWTPLLRPDKGDPAPEKFETRDGFRLIVVTSRHTEDAPPPPDTSARMGTVRVVDAQTKIKGGADAELAMACGVKLVRRNQKKMCEAAFEGNLEEVQGWLEKGYDVESVDAHEHTSLSEAAAKGHAGVVEFLLDQGADPNACNDTGRSPLFRAAFHGHLGMVNLLLQAGGDPRLRSLEETPASVTKDQACKDALQAWDVTVTDRLSEARRKAIQAKLESRITSAVEREALAKDAIRKELCGLAAAGDLRPFIDRMEELTMEALNSREKPRGKVMARDDRGNTLLMIACMKGHVELATRLMTHYKTLDPEFDKDERQVWYCNVNARDGKGWNATSVAAFHCHRAVLELVLEHGGDPTARNVYGKNAFWFGQDEWDMGETMVLKDRGEVREVLNRWESSRVRKLVEAGASEEEAEAVRNVAVAKVVDHAAIAAAAAEARAKAEAEAAAKDPNNWDKDTLKAELKKRKMDTKGKKAALLKRMLEALAKEERARKLCAGEIAPEDMNIKELREELKKRKVDAKGGKDKLVKLLEDVMKKEKKKKKAKKKKKKATAQAKEEEAVAASGGGGGGEEKVAEATAAGSGIKAVRALSPRKG
jgi:ankyrin repeat protein